MSLPGLMFSPGGDKRSGFEVSLVDQSDEDYHNSMMDCGFTSNRAVTIRVHWKRIIAFDKTKVFF